MKPVSESLTAPIGNISAARKLLRAGMPADGLHLLDVAQEQLLQIKAGQLAVEAAAGAQK